jgi:hypothetical protein
MIFIDERRVIAPLFVFIVKRTESGAGMHLYRIPKTVNLPYESLRNNQLQHSKKSPRLA